MIRHRPIFLSVAALLAACSRTPVSEPAGAPLPIPATSPSAPEISGRNFWVLQPDTTPHRFTMSSSTTIDFQDNNGAVRDSIVSGITYSLQTERSDDLLKYFATIESISLKAGQRLSGPSNAILPYSFSGRLEKNKLSMNSLSTDCSNDLLAAASVIQRTVFLLPLKLQKDMTWTDSTTSSMCSGSLPVAATAIRNYRVLGQNAHGILIERHDRTITIGEGSQGQHRVRLRTEGSGMAQITIDPGSGDLLQSTGAWSTAVLITTSGRDQRFTQTVRERIERL